MRRLLHNEEGAALVFVALILVVLLGLTAMVTDMGVVWTARGQAQNAADAGALAGATARAFDEWTDPPSSSGLAYFSAYNTAQANKVFGATPGVAVSWACPSYFSGACVQVNTYRDGSNGSTALPAFFAGVFPNGSSAMLARATATAKIQDANHTECLKPWLIPDKFDDVNGNGVFDPGIDIYTAPGYTENDLGDAMILRPGNPKDAAAPSNFYGIGDAPPYEEEIAGCLLTASIGDVVWTLPGNKVGPTQQGVAELLKDGPVVVVVGLFSPEAWALSDRNTGMFQIVVTNLMGFRIDGVGPGGSIYGVIVGAPGELVAGGGGPPSGAGFLKVITLIR